MFSKIASTWCVQTTDVISGVNSDEELTHGFEDGQIRGIPHDVLNDVHIQRADHTRNLLAFFTLALLEKNNWLCMIRKCTGECL